MQNSFTEKVPPYFLGGEETGSICKWGHQGYYKPVFLRKDSTRTKSAKSTKSTKHKQTILIPLKKFLRVQKAASSAILCSRIFVLVCECFCALIFLLLVCFCLQVFLHLFIKKSNKQVWSWWPHLPILLTWLLSTSLWKIHLYTLIFICLNLWLFVIIFEDFFFLRESLSVSDHHENLSLFKIIMRILPIYDHYENLSLFIIIYENHFFMKIFIICKNFF